MLVFSLARAPLSVSQDATRAVNLLYCRSPGQNLQQFHRNIAGQATSHAVMHRKKQLGGGMPAQQYSHNVKYTSMNAQKMRFGS